MTALKSYIPPIVAILLIVSLGATVITLGTDLITNGNFVSDVSSWVFAKEGKNAKPLGSWEAIGYADGGAVKISSEVGKRRSGVGYWGQTITPEIKAGSSVKLSYAWKKSYGISTPIKQGIYITIVKPNGNIIDIDGQLGAPPSYNTWFTVTDKDVSAYFDQTGSYKIRLRYGYTTGSNANAQAFAWFDEVKLLVSPPPSSWVELTPTPDPGGYGEAVAGTGTHIYTIRTYSATSTPQFWRYIPETNTWAALSISGLPVGAFRNGAALAWDGNDHLYALAGARYSDADRRPFFRYSISADNWVQLADTPAPQGAGDALVWSGHDNRLYAILGSNQHGTTFSRYDPATNLWELLAAPPAGTDDGASLVWTGTTFLYALRGEYYESAPLQDFWQYDIINNAWTIMAPIPEPDGVGDGASLLWLGNFNLSHADYIYALSGGDFNENPGYDFYRYEISSNAWENAPDIPYPIGYYNGNRLGYVGYISYWQGAPSTWTGSGNQFFRLEFAS